MLTKKLKYVKECQYHQSAYSNIPVKLQSIRFWDQIYPEKLNDKNPEKIEKWNCNQDVQCTLVLPLNWNSPCRGEGASHQEVSTGVHQREELNWASQLKSSDQQIFSRMSGTDSPLIRQD